MGTSERRGSVRGGRGRGRVARALLLVSAAVASCGRHEEGTTRAGGRAAAFVSIPPQAYFVERVGGDRASVEVLVRPGQSPATYEPTPRQMAALGRADVYFSIGLPFETALLRKIASSYPGLNIVDTRRGVELLAMAEHGHGEHGHEEHGPEEERGESGGMKDPHIWLDPMRAKVVARTVRDELARLDPGHAGEFALNCEALAADLDRVHAEIGRTLAPMRGKELLVFHPAFGYFADAFGMKQVAVETGGKEPGARALAGLVARMKASGARVVFVQREFSSASASCVAQEIGGAVVPMDPLARDYVGNLKAMAEKVKAALAEEE